uniref:3-hydroxyacyl-CoA dehydrogenase NAD binding domain-containing protein n=1 Tax=Meleagris gallopavo TaxID=9103 RepID=G5E804_MELGA
MWSSCWGCYFFIGLIGRSWAMVFAAGGFKVRLYDIAQQQLTTALENIRKQMKELEESGFLKGTLSAEKQLALISICTDLKAAVEGATFIQVKLFTCVCNKDCTC